MPETATSTILGWRMRIFLVLSRWSKILQQPLFSTCSSQTMLLLVTVDAASLLFALVFLKCRSNINMFQVKKFNLMSIKLAPQKPQWKSPKNRVRKKTTITKSKGVPVPMERIWAQLGFTASLCHHQLQCHQNHSGDQKLFSLYRAASTLGNTLICSVTDFCVQKGAIATWRGKSSFKKFGHFSRKC